jgi:hypothetical protein
VSTSSRTVDDLLDAIEDLLDQCCGTADGDLDHAFMSTYEDAVDLLVECRPERWEATHYGARRRV